jgi:hypothetical protein
LIGRWSPRRLEQTDAGLVPASSGWFVLNARDARWFPKPELQDGAIAYVRFPPSRVARRRDGLLPG